MLDACAFLVWNLASRSPAQLLRDLASGFSRPAVAGEGIVRALAGVLLLAAAAVALEAVSIGSRTYLILETWTVLTGLLVEQLIGPDVRAWRQR